MQAHNAPAGSSSGVDNYSMPDHMDAQYSVASDRSLQQPHVTTMDSRQSSSSIDKTHLARAVNPMPLSRTTKGPLLRILSSKMFDSFTRTFVNDIVLTVDTWSGLILEITWIGNFGGASPDQVAKDGTFAGHPAVSHSGPFGTLGLSHLTYVWSFLRDSYC